MAQLLQKYQNHNQKSDVYQKWFVQPVYPAKFITTQDLADFIQTQASVKRSDCKAVLDELGSALQHYLGLGQKVKIDNVGIFKVGVSSAGSTSEALCTASNVKKARVLFQPETESTQKGTKTTRTGAEIKVYSHTPVMLKEVTYELAQDSVNGKSRQSTPASPSTGG